MKKFFLAVALLISISFATKAQTTLPTGWHHIQPIVTVTGDTLKFVKYVHSVDVTDSIETIAVIIAQKYPGEKLPIVQRTTKQQNLLPITVSYRFTRANTPFSIFDAADADVKSYIASDNHIVILD